MIHLAKNFKSLKPEDWDVTKGVKVAEATKLKWIKECLDYLKDNPKEPWTEISSGDTVIRVTRHDTFFDIQEYEPRKWVMIENDPAAPKACSCPLPILNSTGCKCGGI